MGKKKPANIQEPEKKRSRRGGSVSGGEDDEDALNEELNDDALREMMYEQAHYRRGQAARKDEEDINVGQYSEKQYDDREDNRVLDQNMDNHLLQDVLDSPLKKVRQNKI